MQSNPDVKVFLIGNKTDLEEKRKVNKEVAEQYKNDNNLDLYIETSAKNGYNAKNVFIEAAKILYKDYLKYKDRASRQSSICSTSSVQQYNPNIRLPGPSTIDITNEDKKNKKGCAC
jgi:GTPase SAR1 family protein